MCHLGLLKIFCSVWLILGQKTTFLMLELYQVLSQPPFWVGTSSLDTMYFTIVFCWMSKILAICPTYFGLKNYVFDLKTLLGYISVPFRSWDFIFDTLYLSIDFCRRREILLCMTDFGLKTMFLALKLYLAIFQPPFWVGTSSLDTMCFSIRSWTFWGCQKFLASHDWFWTKKLCYWR